MPCSCAEAKVSKCSSPGSETSVVQALKAGMDESGCRSPKHDPAARLSGPWFLRPSNGVRVTLYLPIVYDLKLGPLKFS